jgi:hypothetical protein
MKKTICLLAISLAFSLIIAPARRAFAHKYHTSVTRVEYNQAERSAEITIQTFTDDLRDVLQKRAGAVVRLDAGKNTDRLVFDYLRSTFELKNGAAVRDGVAVCDGENAGGSRQSDTSQRPSLRLLRRPGEHRQHPSRRPKKQPRF